MAPVMRFWHQKSPVLIVEGMNPHASLLPKPLTPADQNFMLRLHEALEASWDKQTAYQDVEQAGNRAYGQCYPTSRVIQNYGDTH